MGVQLLSPCTSAVLQLESLLLLLPVSFCCFLVKFKIWLPSTSAISTVLYSAAKLSSELLLSYSIFFFLSFFAIVNSSFYLFYIIVITIRTTLSSNFWEIVYQEDCYISHILYTKDEVVTFINKIFCLK